MKYPYIGGIDSDCKTLFLDECYGIAMEHDELEITGIPEHDWSEDEFKNITREYLQNTWGVVESKEHAEFIIELAELHGFEVDENSDNPKSFMIYDDVISIYSFSHKELSNEDGRKQITIPLPPKEPLKNAGDNLILGCEDSKCDEWPCVNDIVVTRGGSNGVVKISKPDKDGMIVCVFDGEYALTYKSELQKPKTPEEELFGDICGIIAKSILGNKTNGEITNILIDKYNIKPQ